jgi:hypothetical protein
MDGIESRLGLRVDEDLHLEVKRWCIDHRITVKEFTEEAWRDKLARGRAKEKKVR